MRSSSTGTASLSLDGFAAVPRGEGELDELSIPFGDEVVPYSIGPASCAVPGLPAALGELSERHGRLPWTRLCEPALALARTGVPLPEMHARTLEMLGELLTLGRGGDLFMRDGRLLGESDVLRQPGLVDTLEALAEEGAASVYRGSLAEALLRVDGVVVDADDLAGYRPLWRDPVLVEYVGRRVATRGGLSGVPELLPRLPALRGRRRDGAHSRPRGRVHAGPRRAASTRRTSSRSMRTGAPACSRTRSASAPASGFPASTPS